MYPIYIMYTENQTYFSGFRQDGAEVAKSVLALKKQIAVIKREKQSQVL